MAARHPTSSVSTSIAIARPTSSISLRSTTSNPFSPALTCLNVTRLGHHCQRIQVTCCCDDEHEQAKHSNGRLGPLCHRTRHYVTSLLSRTAIKWNMEHVRAARHLMRYLRPTTDLCLTFDAESTKASVSYGFYTVPRATGDVSRQLYSTADHYRHSRPSIP